MATAVVVGQPLNYYGSIEDRLRPSCKAPSPFSQFTSTLQMLDDPVLDDPAKYSNALVAGDTAHDEISVIAGLIGKGGSVRGKSYEDNMMTNTKNTELKDMKYILNTFGSIKIVPNDPNAENPYDPLALNAGKCNILDVWVPGGSFFCPGYNNFIDSATTSYNNFIMELRLENPLNKKPLLFQQQGDKFEFTALLNYDILLFALYLSTMTEDAIIVTLAELTGTPLEKAKKMNILVMNFFWENLMKETLRAINNDYVLLNTIASSNTSGKNWAIRYTEAIELLQNIDFVDMNIAKNNINFMIWKIKNPAPQYNNANYAWGITQGTSATSILQILKQIFCCTPRGSGNSKKVDKTSCSDGLEKLLEIVATDNTVSAALHSICKFIGDTSHITFGNLIQMAKNKAGIEELVNRIRTTLVTGAPNVIIGNIKAIKIIFWISERPMATRLCLDKQIFEDYSVSISRSTGKIIEELYSSGVFDENKKEYLLVNFDKLESSKVIINELVKIFRILEITPDDDTDDGKLGKKLLNLKTDLEEFDETTSDIEKNLWAVSVKNFNDTECTDIKNRYKTKYLLKQINDLKSPQTIQTIKKVVDLL